MIGKSVSHYTIIEELGRGGMGVVYRAEDLKLKRTVALKFLPPHAVADPTEKERFAREAQAAAALNHPNIATVFEIDDGDEHPYIAMEYVRGKSLKDLLIEGPMKIGRALDIAAQIAEGLHAAHEKGVVHRDMKNANVMVTERDHVKIMDFGLAKLKGASLLTKQGTTLGTVSYMSPEQARGESVDHRTDIWSFGVVLYEMLTGRSPFAGEFEQAIIYNILNNEPEPLTAVRSGMPMELERIVNKCLAKEPADRYQNIQEVPVDLRAVKASMKSSSSDLSRTIGASRVSTVGRASSSARIQDAQPPVRRSGGARAAWIVAALMTLIAAAAVFTSMKNAPVEAEPVRLQVSLPAGEAMSINTQTSVAISRDGSKIVYRTVNRLFLRRMNKNEATPVDGTERASTPFFSPDGKWIGFAADGKLQKVPIEGGSPFALADISDSRGASWGTNGRIVFVPSTGTGLMSVSEGGGEVTVLTTVDTTTDERTHRWPDVLPGGKTVLFTVGTVHSPDYYEDATIDAVNIETGERKKLIRGASSARYLNSGHILYSRSGVLYAVPFDADRVEITGVPFPVVQNIAGDPTSGAMDYAVSDDGTLIYIPGQTEINNRHLVKYDLSGRVVDFDVPVQSYIEPKISPDGTRIAVTIGTGKDFDIWTYDIGRKTLSRLTFGGVNRSPVWSPDGTRIAYFSYITAGVNSVTIKNADGSGEAEVIYKNDRRFYIDVWTRDGKYLILNMATLRNSSDIHLLPLADPKQTVPFLATQFDEYISSVSPDGKWLAYSSNETGVYQIYVRKFPDGGGKWQISTDEGLEPRWAPDGKTLYYISGGRLMAVAIDVAASFTNGTPRALISGIRLLPVDSGQSYDITPDGKWLVTTQSGVGSESLTTIQVILNVFSELRENSGTGK